MKKARRLSVSARTRLAAKVEAIRAAGTASSPRGQRMMTDLSAADRRRAITLLEALTPAEIKEATGAKSASDKTEAGRALVVSAAAVCALLRVPEPSWKVARRVVRADGFTMTAASLRRSQLTHKSGAIAAEVLRQHDSTVAPLLELAATEERLLNSDGTRLDEGGAVGRVTRALVQWAAVMCGAAMTPAHAEAIVADAPVSSAVAAAPAESAGAEVEAESTGPELDGDAAKEAEDQLAEELAAAAPLVAISAEALGGMKKARRLSVSARTRLAAKVEAIRAAGTASSPRGQRMMTDLSAADRRRAITLLEALTPAEIKEATGAKSASDKTEAGRALVVSAAAVCALLRVPEPSWKVARRVVRADGFTMTAASLRRSQLTHKSGAIAAEVLRQHDSTVAPLLELAATEERLLNSDGTRLDEGGAVGRVTRALVQWAAVMCGAAMTPAHAEAIVADAPVSSAVAAAPAESAGAEVEAESTGPELDGDAAKEAEDQLAEELAAAAPLVAISAGALGGMKKARRLSVSARTRLAAKVEAIRAAGTASSPRGQRMMTDLSAADRRRAITLLEALTPAEIKEATGAKSASDKTEAGRALVVSAAAVCALLRVPEPSWKVARRVVRADGFTMTAASLRRSQLTHKSGAIAAEVLRQHDSTVAPLLELAATEERLLNSDGTRLDEGGAVGRVTRALVQWAAVMCGAAMTPAHAEAIVADAPVSSAVAAAPAESAGAEVEAESTGPELDGDAAKEAEDQLAEELAAAAPLVAISAGALGGMKKARRLSVSARTRLAAKVEAIRAAGTASSPRGQRMMTDLSAADRRRAITLLEALTPAEIKEATGAKSASDKTEAGRALVVSAAAVCALLRVPEPSWKVARRVVRADGFTMTAASLRRSQLTHKSGAIAAEVLRQHDSTVAPLLELAATEERLLNSDGTRLDEGGAVGRVTRALVQWAAVMCR
ncbi:hypothetical protein FNF31_03930 [Cafeteria roenbergensis]|uniref:Uncharacterized protein n=1 Tax=Cafeteria roenbergensis TaxID=33653 RepID=A0A5A8D7E9_CAFRO|nr:hypothetical protein FNF31_03930 [Cafeteria roenbergensis]